ncbi:MAG: methionine--tRNA ligase subunit beta [Candidatus ainarchaeum sp.]|nr:methionine--tRNA ligase subunit beta [Candidatus ainarchaeum sp.]
MNIKENIDFLTFMKLDIRLGEIIEAERVEKSNKLLRLVFDFGNFKRQILAGIGTKYNPEDLLNKQLPVIVNLEPRKLMGLESQGMILAIGENEVEALLFPSEKIENGSNIH